MTTAHTKTKKPTKGKKKVKGKGSRGVWGLASVLLYLALFVGIGVISGVISFRLLSYGREVSVPAVTQLRLSEAAATLRETGLRYTISGRRHDESIPAARIILQDIPPGDVVKEKTSVGLVVSLGSAYRETPDFLGRTIEESRLLAQRDGVSIVRVARTHHQEVDSGRVVAQNPVPGTAGRPDVALLVSAGPFQVNVPVPNLIGQRAAVAQAILSEQGLRYRSEGSGGVIMWQRPEAGIPVPEGSEVTVGLDLGTGESEQYPWEGTSGQGWRE